MKRNQRLLLRIISRLYSNRLLLCAYAYAVRKTNKRNIFSRMQVAVASGRWYRDNILRELRDPKYDMPGAACDVCKFEVIMQRKISVFVFHVLYFHVIVLFLIIINVRKLLYKRLHI